MMNENWSKLNKCSNSKVKIKLEYDVWLVMGDWLYLAGNVYLVIFNLFIKIWIVSMYGHG